jgi:cytochrome c-type biogenesis protein CcmH
MSAAPSPSAPPPSALAKGSPLRAWLPWAVLFVVVIGFLAYGSQGTTGEMTAQDRVTNLARTIKCPTCSGESSAESNAPSSQEVRRDIALRVEQGQSDDDIRGYYASRYGEDILLTPPSSGLGALVWVIPVVAGAAAVLGLVLVFRRWQQEARAATVSDADRSLVDEALRRRDELSHDPHGEGSSR